jgi:hypothetical protein
MYSRRPDFLDEGNDPAEFPEREARILAPQEARNP